MERKRETQVLFISYDMKVLRNASAFIYGETTISMQVAKPLVSDGYILIGGLAPLLPFTPWISYWIQTIFVPEELNFTLSAD